MIVISFFFGGGRSTLRGPGRITKRSEWTGEKGGFVCVVSCPRRSSLVARTRLGDTRGFGRAWSLRLRQRGTPKWYRGSAGGIIKRLGVLAADGNRAGTSSRLQLVRSRWIHRRIRSHDARAIRSAFALEERPLLTYRRKVFDSRAVHSQVFQPSSSRFFR